MPKVVVRFLLTSALLMSCTIVWAQQPSSPNYSLVADVISSAGEPIQGPSESSPVNVLGESAGESATSNNFSLSAGFEAGPSSPPTKGITVQGTIDEANLDLSSVTVRVTNSQVTNSPCAQVQVNGTPPSYTFSAVCSLSVGMNAITAAATDLVGLTGSHTITVTLDVQPPPVPGVDPITTPTTLNPITLTGTKAPDASVWIDDNGSGPTLLVDGNQNPLTAWSASYALVENLNVLTFTAKDQAGNASAPIVVSVLLDQAPPVPAITNPLNGFHTTQPTIPVSGTTTPDTVSLAVNGVGVTFNKANSFLWTWTTASNVPLTEGTNTVTATAINTQGQSSTTSITVTLDTIPPAAPGVNPVPSPTSQNPISVTGTKEAGAGITRNGQSVAPIGDPLTTWSDSVTLTLGPNILAYTQTDQALNVSPPTTITVAFDNTPPTTPAVTDDGATTTSTTQLHAVATSTDTDTSITDWCWAAGDQNDPDASDGYNNLVNWSCGKTNAVTLTVPTMTHGVQYYLSAKAVNAAGLASAIGSSDGIVSNQPPGTPSVFPPDLSFYCSGDQVLMQVKASDPDDALPTLTYAFSVTHTSSGTLVFNQPFSSSTCTCTGPLAPGTCGCAIWNTASALGGVYSLNADVKDPFGAITSCGGTTPTAVCGNTEPSTGLWEIAVVSCSIPPP